MGNVTVAGSFGGTQNMVTLPENPLTDVSIYGIDPTPLEGIVVLLALSVKLGLDCAPARPAATRRRANRHAR
jgi:hypothetical protein